MALRVFVVRELFPFTAGGIGRVAANILATSTAAELKDTAIVYLADGLDRKRFNEVYPGVRFVSASPACYQQIDSDGRRFPPPEAYDDSALHGESVRAMQALVQLERDEGALGYVEFGDWGATALAACQEKRLGHAFASATLAVRLHSTDSVLGAVEGRLSDIHALALYDLERKALADCDMIVAQLGSVADRMKSFYGFSDEAWDPRVVVHAPPVLLDRGEAKTGSVAPSLDMPIVFSSKLQRLKRPDVFVRGCAAFLRSRPDYVGDVVFLAHSFDPTYQAQIQRLVPWDLRGRFRFVEKASQDERASTISHSVCVFPTIWESFCLAAYEASLSGARCILNATNPAFDDRSPWIAGINCEKFDDSAEALCAALERTFVHSRPYEVVRVPSDAVPWANSRAMSTLVATQPLVSVVVPHYNLGAYLQRTIDSVLTSTYTNVEVVIVDDASTESVSVAIISRLAQLDDPRFKVIKAPYNRGLAGTRNAALAHCAGKYVLPLDADDLIGPDFIRLAVHALENDPIVDFVVPQVAYFEDGAEGAIHTSAELKRCYVLIGEARASGLHQNRFSTATMLVRADVLRELRYREEMVSYEDWDLYLRAVSAGHRFVVTNDVQFFYRARHDSMIHSPEGRAGHRFAYHDVLRDKSMTVGGMVLPLYAMEGFAAGTGLSVAQGGDVAEMQAKLAFYENSRVIRITTGMINQIRAKAPWLVPIGRRSINLALRVVRRLRR